MSRIRRGAAVGCLLVGLAGLAGPGCAGPPAAFAETPTAPADTARTPAPTEAAASGLPAPEDTVGAPPPAAEPTADTASTATADPAAPPKPVKAMLLPVEFNVYQSGVGSMLESMPEWTRAARENLSRAAVEVAAYVRRAELVPLPELTPDEKAALHDHVALARLIVAQGGQLGAKAFAFQRAGFDRTFGGGLRFLRERTGADLAILLDGTQVEQSGGSIFMQLARAAADAVAAGGGGTQVVASVLDLARGSSFRPATWKPPSRTPAVCTGIRRSTRTRNPSSTDCSRSSPAGCACARTAMRISTLSPSRLAISA